VVLVDAGISGGAAAADKGTLTLMIGGPPGIDATLDPVFRHFAAKVVHMGETGNGHATKLPNNFLNSVTLAATAEVMVACVFRPIVTDHFGSVTADFGIVTGHFGIVTEAIQ